MNVKAHLLVQTGRSLYILRRYHRVEDRYHDGECLLKELAPDEKGEMPPEHSDLWPKQCGDCNYVFTPEDGFSTREETIWRRDNGEELLISDAKEGDIWDADWMKGMYDTPDGKILIAMCPGGHHWTIDGRASNCDMLCKNCRQPYHKHISTAVKKQQHPDWPNDANCTNYEDVTKHNCWIRHGTPPNLTVDKQGVTCGAGAGSIQTGNWHGFLRNGVFVQC